MQYIVHTDFNGKAICGEVTLSAGMECTEIDGTIYHNARAVCLIGSENSYRHFARNDDGNGLKRGELIKTIKAALALQDDHNYERWHRVWNAPICRQFNRGGDTWNWNFAFYNADIPYLEYILAMVTDEDWLGIQPEEPE